MFVCLTFGFVTCYGVRQGFPFHKGTISPFSSREGTVCRDTSRSQISPNMLVPTGSLLSPLILSSSPPSGPEMAFLSLDFVFCCGKPSPLAAYRAMWTPFTPQQGWTLQPDGHRLAQPKKGILPEPRPSKTEARSRWEQQISPGLTCQDPDGVWEGSTETRGLSFCHGLFLVRCGSGQGRAEEAVSGTERSAGRRVAGRPQIRACNRKPGSRSSRLPRAGSKPSGPAQLPRVTKAASKGGRLGLSRE